MLLKKLNEKSKEIVPCRIPSHIGIKGNIEADKAAEAALTQKITKSKVPHTDLQPQIKAHIEAKWKLSWDMQTNNKFKEVRKTTPKS